MTLIKSISGIRGTIGGRQGENLTPVDIVMFTAAFGQWIRKDSGKEKVKIVTGRDARQSGKMIADIVNATLQAMGIDIIDIGLASTPTVEIAVQGTGADGGIIITASHNPEQWNALKLLNRRGEFLSESDGKEVINISQKNDFVFADSKSAGRITRDETWAERHTDLIMNLKLVNSKLIASAGFKVVVDCINSVGSMIIPGLLKKLGVREYILINEVPDGKFSHNPEPLPENLIQLSEKVKTTGADVGIAVDPDVDRLAIVCENGEMFGEEYTLVAVADYVLSHTPGNTVSNMSSTRALRDVTVKYGGKHFTSAVGEVNVIEEMKEREAVIGGEGNGGVIYPELHYGRDALVGIALFLTHLASQKTTCSELRKRYPDYFLVKTKIAREKDFKIEKIKKVIKETFPGSSTDERDGILVESNEGWVHARTSNTEPIIRVYAEAKSPGKAAELAEKMARIVKNV
ncbi:MAG: phosphoglucosamine mutase [Bacteroidales bacterium]